MTISVVVPVYNIERYVSKCIDSLVNQTFRDYEIILVDDGSTDNSGRICETYSEKYSKVFSFHKENGGLSDARNYGVQMAKGDYLLFIDGDDYVAEDALELIAENIRTYQPDIVLTEGMFEAKGDNTRLVRRFEKEQFQGISGKEALRLSSAIFPNWSGCGKCFKMSFWKENQFEFKKGRLSEDFQLIDRVVLCAQTVGMVSEYYYYQYRESSIVHTVNVKLVRDMIENLKEWNAYLEEADLDEELKKQIYGMHSRVWCHNVLGYIYLVDKDERRDLLEAAASCGECIKYGRGTEAKLIRLAIKIIGLNVTCLILGSIKKYRLKHQK